MAEQADGRRFGAYGMVLAPEGIVFIEKPGKGRGRGDRGTCCTREHATHRQA